MNCKPGDLAYIVAPATMNLGRVVEVVAADEPFKGYACWRVRVTGQPLIGNVRGEKVARLGTNAMARCLDIALRPISGVPLNDEVDAEVSSW